MMLVPRDAWPGDVEPGTPRPEDVEQTVGPVAGANLDSYHGVERERRQLMEPSAHGTGEGRGDAGSGLGGSANRAREARRWIAAAPGKVRAAASAAARAVQWPCREHPGPVALAALFLTAVVSISVVIVIISRGAHDSSVTSSSCSEVGRP